MHQPRETLDSLSFRVSAITDYFFGALQHAASASQRAVRKASQTESLWHYPLQFV
jgi:hypothetical protein